VPVPSYGKILTLGSVGTEGVMDGPLLIVQEKVDGSQFGFGWALDGEFCMRSHNAQIDPLATPGQFKEAIDVCQRIGEKLQLKGLFVYCEYLQKPKHNTIKYGRVPLNHLMLFDACNPTGWLTRRDLRVLAHVFEIELVPDLYIGPVSLEALKNLLTMPSVLGGSAVEGVVLKDYTKSSPMSHTGIFPLMAKFVNDEFKERNKKEWKANSPKGTLDTYAQTFCSPPRWQKAVQHLADEGKLTHSPRDIGLLVAEVKRDIVEEEGPMIKEELYNLMVAEILRHSVRGLPEWYKAKLLERLDEPK
jgi:hypothetical protein